MTPPTYSSTALPKMALLLLLLAHGITPGVGYVMPCVSGARHACRHAPPAAMAGPSSEQLAAVQKALADDAARNSESGRDPRFAPPWVAENDELLAEMAATSAKEPKMTSSSPAVGMIHSLDDLEAALARSQAAGRLLVLKYYTPICRSCAAIKPLYERAADLLVGAVDFYECGAAYSRVLFRWHRWIVALWVVATIVGAPFAYL